MSLENEEETEVVVLGVRPRTFSDSRSVFLLAGPLLTRVYAARDRRDIFSGACRRRLISSYEMRYFPENKVEQEEINYGWNVDNSLMTMKLKKQKQKADV